MSEPFKFDLVAPERLLMSEEVVEVVVPGTEGDFGVLKDHAPFMSTIRPGFITVREVSGGERNIFIRGGFADTNPNGLTILAEQAMPIEELDRGALTTEMGHAREDLSDAKTDEARAAAQRRIDEITDVLTALDLQ